MQQNDSLADGYVLLAQRRHRPGRPHVQAAVADLPAGGGRGTAQREDPDDRTTPRDGSAASPYAASLARWAHLVRDDIDPGRKHHRQVRRVEVGQPKVPDLA